MPFLGHRLAFTQLLVAVGVNLLFIASAGGPAIGSRASIAIPNLSRALSHLTDLSPTTDFDSESLTATDDNVNISIASIATSNLSLLPSIERAPRTSAPPNLAHSSSRLTTPNPTTDFDSESLAAADDYVNIGVAFIAGANISSLPPTERASRSSALPSLVRSSPRLAMPSPTTDFDLGSHARADASAGAGFVIAVSAGTVSIASTGDNAASTIANQPHLASLTVFEPDPIPGLPTRSDPFAGDLLADDSAILAIASTAAAIIASNGGSDVQNPSRAAHIARSRFPSRHSTSIAIRHALTSTADADGPSKTDPHPTRDPTRPYHSMDGERAAAAVIDRRLHGVE